jgi:hypothetical protein
LDHVSKSGLPDWVSASKIRGFFPARIFVACTGKQTGREPDRHVCIGNVAEGGD